jgi:3-deoxy-7-phosphoheptulonate synthase
MCTAHAPRIATPQPRRTFRILAGAGFGDALPPAAAAYVARRRAEIAAALAGEDPRMLVFVGPCSVHHVGATRDYLARLRALAAELPRLIVVPRLYLEKPRTTLGWPGLVADPHLDGSGDIRRGIQVARRLLADAAQMGLPAVTEVLTPAVGQLLDDLLACATIGARTAESPVHRQYASGAPCPIGVKNATCGSVEAAVAALRAAAGQHRFLGTCPSTGLLARTATRGNADTFAILRGGRSGENYAERHVRAAGEALAAAGIVGRRIVVDASHGNSGRDHRRQRAPFLAAAEMCRQGILAGAMLESFLEEGAQKIPEDLRGFGRRRARRGLSVTDACVGWDETEELLRLADEAMGRA